MGLACDSGSGDPTGQGIVAPRFTAPLLGGAQFDSADYAGRPLVVNFWATTCEPCIREMPLLEAAADRYEDDGLVVVGVNYLEGSDRIESFFAQLNFDVDYPTVLDLDGDIGRHYGVALLPTTFFIDGDGIVLYRRLGEVHDRHFDEGWARIGGEG